MASLASQCLLACTLHILLTHLAQSSPSADVLHINSFRLLSSMRGGSSIMRSGSRKNLGPAAGAPLQSTDTRAPNDPGITSTSGFINIRISALVALAPKLIPPA